MKGLPSLSPWRRSRVPPVLLPILVSVLCLAGCTRPPAEPPEAEARRIVRAAVTIAERGDNRRAIEEFDRALRLHSNNAEAIYLRGAAHDRLGEQAAALADYDAALRIDANLLPAYVARAVIHTARGNKAAADADYAAARRLAGDDQVH